MSIRNIVVVIIIVSVVTLVVSDVRSAVDSNPGPLFIHPDARRHTYVAIDLERR